MRSSGVGSWWRWIDSSSGRSCETSRVDVKYSYDWRRVCPPNTRLTFISRKRILFLWLAKSNGTAPENPLKINALSTFPRRSRKAGL